MMAGTTAPARAGTTLRARVGVLVWSFSLAALERQAALLEQAHDSLTAALDAVDRR